MKTHRVLRRYEVHAPLRFSLQLEHWFQLVFSGARCFCGLDGIDHVYDGTSRALQQGEVSVLNRGHSLLDLTLWIVMTLLASAIEIEKG